MAEIRINNTVISGVSGKSIVTINGKVFIDGIEQKIDDKVINITVTGDLETLDVAVAEKIIINGNAKDVSSTSGDIEVTNDILGDAKTTSGNIKATSIKGDVKTVSGNVKATSIGGKVKTLSGDIKTVQGD